MVEKDQQNPNYKGKWSNFWKHYFTFYNYGQWIGHSYEQFGILQQCASKQGNKRRKHKIRRKFLRFFYQSQYENGFVWICEVIYG